MFAAVAGFPSFASRSCTICSSSAPASTAVVPATIPVRPPHTAPVAPAAAVPAPGTTEPTPAPRAPPVTAPAAVPTIVGNMLAALSAAPRPTAPGSVAAVFTASQPAVVVSQKPLASLTFLIAASSVFWPGVRFSCSACRCAILSAIPFAMSVVSPPFTSQTELLRLRFISS